MRILLCLICCLICGSLAAQKADSSVIEMSGLRSFDDTPSKFLFRFFPRNSHPDQDIPKLTFNQSFPWKKIPDMLMEQDCYIKFTVHNNEDTIRKAYFFPGYYVKTFRVFSADPGDLAGTFRLVQNDTQASKVYTACLLFSVPPHQTKTYFSKITFLRTQINNYNPAVLNSDYLWTWVMLTRRRMEYLNITTYLACGIMLLMIFYSLAVFAQNRHREFVYYSAYAFCTGIMLFLKSFLDFTPTPFNLFFEEYLDLMILCAGLFFYLGFIRKFLNTGVREPFLEMMLRVAGTALVILVVVYSYLYFFTDKYIVLNVVENYVMKILIFAMGIIVVVYSFRKKDPLLNYLAAGNIALIFFSAISLTMLILRWKLIPSQPSSLLNRSLFYYEIGLISELGLFLFGLAYKNKVDIIAQVKER